MWIAESSGHAFIHSVNIDRAPSHGMGGALNHPGVCLSQCIKLCIKHRKTKDSPCLGEGAL